MTQPIDLTDYRIGDWMQTYSGGRWYPLDPRPDDVDIIDIAHALSLTCRFNGHISEFYSVAQHCLFVAQLVPAEYKLSALLHDAAEAYLNDIVRPVKRYLSDYKALEASTERAIRHRFDLGDETSPGPIRDADSVACLTEAAALFPQGTIEGWSGFGDLKPCRIFSLAHHPGLSIYKPIVAEARYLATFAQLMKRPPHAQS